MDVLAVIPSHQLKKYQGDHENLQHLAVAFTGSPRKHPSDPDKILLLSDPFSQQSFFYEFRSRDIMYAEEIRSLAMPDGSTLSMARLWIKKGVMALRLTPFQVHDTKGFMDSYF